MARQQRDERQNARRQERLQQELQDAEREAQRLQEARRQAAEREARQRALVEAQQQEVAVAERRRQQQRVLELRRAEAARVEARQKARQEAAAREAAERQQAEAAEAMRMRREQQARQAEIHRALLAERQAIAARAPLPGMAHVPVARPPDQVARMHQRLEVRQKIVGSLEARLEVARQDMVRAEQALMPPAAAPGETSSPVQRLRPRPDEVTPSSMSSSMGMLVPPQARADAELEVKEEELPERTVPVSVAVF